MASKANEQITVSLTYSWTFNEKEWKGGKKHWEKLKEHHNLEIGYDHINSWYNLNDVAQPELADCSVKIA